VSLIVLSVNADDLVSGIGKSRRNWCPQRKPI
jgi:hypothetical protein